MSIPCRRTSSRTTTVREQATEHIAILQELMALACQAERADT